MEIPQEIRKDGESGILIKWPNLPKVRLESRSLRGNCPSASSKEKRKSNSGSERSVGRASLKVIKNTIDEELRLVRIDPVGNYAIRIVWGDGHNTGIYSFEFLKELSDKFGKELGEE